MRESPAGNIAQALRRRFERQGLAVQTIETHISWVLLAGDFAYKIKKPVRMGFLDFSTLEARRHGCEEELRLNARLAASLYIGVLAIRATAEGPSLEGGDAAGPVVDFAVQMHRLPPHSLASERLAQGLLEARHLSCFAERLDRFQRAAPVASLACGHGTPAVVARQAQALLDALAAMPGLALPPLLRPWLADQALRLAGRWQRRLEEGHVREGHGDLHLDNVIVLGEDVTAFDCIEFAPALRWIDVISDVAFLVMDLLSRGRGDLAHGFLNTWLERSGDYAGLPVLRHYLVYRALVRALVAGLRERDPLDRPDPPDLKAGAGPGAAAYLTLAAALAGGGQPRLLITHGLPGSGKSHVSQRLLEAAGAIRVRSDIERKRQAGLGALERSAGAPGAASALVSAPASAPASASASRPSAELYDRAATEATYQRLARVAGDALEGGFATIVDAAFLERDKRDHFRRLALERRVPFHILDCQAPMALLRERVRQRAARGDDPSEADGPVLERLAHAVQPLDETERAQALVVQTDGPLDAPALVRRWRAGAGITGAGCADHGA